MNPKINRRMLLRWSMLAGAGGWLAACTPAAPNSSSYANAGQTSATLASRTTAATSAAALAPEITEAASKFLAALDDKQRAKATYAFTDAERTRWHWTTPSGFPRHGLPLKEMSQSQQDLAFALLHKSVSDRGFQKALDIISLQNDLGNDPQLYYVTIFGTPGTEPWGWRFEGHHLSRHFTLAQNQLTVMPFFLGAWPTVNDAGLKAMEREEWAARELVTSLADNKRQIAIFEARALGQHVTQNQPYVKPLAPVGLAASEFNPDQQKLLQEVLQTYLNTLPANLAATHLDRIHAAGLEQIHFGWAGALEARKPYYYRLQGPTFLLEHDNSRNGGTHIHSVWRDFAEDFGAQMLG
jgi:hypothetical protein